MGFNGSPKKQQLIRTWINLLAIAILSVREHLLFLIYNTFSKDLF
jgi:hypothetical protein